MERLNIDSAEFYLEEPVGMQFKEWVIIFDKKYLFKETTIKQDGSSTFNDVSECLVSDVVKLIGVDVASYYLCSNKEKNGVVTPDFLDNKINTTKKEELIDGVSLINKIDPDFKNKSLINPQTHQYYTVSLLLDSVISYGLVKNALEMIVVDALIGNTDRNPSNYGIIINHESGNIRFAPLYDNATSLGISMVQHRLEKCIDSEGNVVDQEHLDLVTHHHIVGKVTLDRFFQRHEKEKWDEVETTRILSLIEEKREELQTLLKEEKISPQDYHKELDMIGNQYRKYDITTMEYQPLFAYLTRFYSKEIEDIVMKIKTNLTEENIDKIFSSYKENLPKDRYEFARQLVLQRSKWIVNYYEKQVLIDKEESRGKKI